MTDASQNIHDAQVVKAAQRATWVGFAINALLSIAKILAGIFGRSAAMIADGVHSLSDFVTDIIVVVFMSVSRRKANADYQYGHGKFETLATMLIAVILGIVGVLFFLDGAEKVMLVADGGSLDAPTWPALVMAILSIAVKEWLYRYTRRVGERIRSAVVIANAWHHRSDAFSSLATLAGVAGAMTFGSAWRILDPLAAMVVSIFIFAVAIKIGKPAVMELLEVSLPTEVVEGMFRVIGATQGVKAFHHFASRRNGNMMIIDFHIKVDPDVTVEHAHAIASDVENRLKQAYGRDMLITIHIEPYRGQAVDHNNRCE